MADEEFIILPDVLLCRHGDRDLAQWPPPRAYDAWDPLHLHLHQVYNTVGLSPNSSMPYKGEDTMETWTNCKNHVKSIDAENHRYIENIEETTAAPQTVILSCPTLEQELKRALECHASNAAVVFLPRHLHNDPKELHRYLQDKIDHLHQVHRIVLCVSRCGGGTANLRASTAEIILPRTRDCLDILLSGHDLNSLCRNIRGIYFTASWMNFSKESDIDLAKLTAKMGKEAAEAYLRQLYKTFNEFYIIDTDCYDIQEVKDYIEPLVKILDGSITVIRGEFKILHKIAAETFDDDFIVIPKGCSVPAEAFLPNR